MLRLWVKPLPCCFKKGVFMNEGALPPRGMRFQEGKESTTGDTCLLRRLCVSLKLSYLQVLRPALRPQLRPKNAR